MKRETVERQPYRRPLIETYEAVKIVETLGPVSAGSGEPCGPMLPNYCPPAI